MQPTLDGFCEAFWNLKRKRMPLVVVTLVGCRGSVPNQVGARMIVGGDDEQRGTVGGGKLELRCVEVAREMLVDPSVEATQLLTWNLQTEIGMSCGGEVTLFFERFLPAEVWRIAVFGAGHVSQALCPILTQLDCDLTVIDPRQDWLDKLPPASDLLKKLLATEMQSALNQIDPNSFVLMMTMGHGFDFPVLYRALTEFQFPFLGVIGSTAKRARLERELRQAGYEGEMDFACPLGEDFGSNAPMEIALSISAQLLKRRDQWRLSLMQATIKKEKLKTRFNLEQ
jgi:xanthine dehydrogenase accessory factor